MSIADGKGELTEAVKASVFSSGALTNLKQVSHDGSAPSKDDGLHELKQQAQAAIENVQQMLDGGRLDGGASQKLIAVLNRLKTALAKDNISRAALTTALSEAATAMSGVDGDGQSLTQQQITEKLWQRVDADNKEIDDDFEKMRKAGILFNDKLWNRHKELMEYLQNHPHDIKTQKELDAVDDAMLLQAEPQTRQHPDAEKPFQDAKKKSEERHEVVDKKLADVGKRASLDNAAFDDNTHSASEKLILDDVPPQFVGHKQMPSGKQRS